MMSGNIHVHIVHIDYVHIVMYILIMYIYGKRSFVNFLVFYFKHLDYQLEEQPTVP